jgi:hypothetical protein
MPQQRFGIRFKEKGGKEKENSCDPSSTVQKVKMLVLNDLEKAKIALALHFRAYFLIIYSSRNVGGSATPEARIAAEAFAWS